MNALAALATAERAGPRADPLPTASTPERLAHARLLEALYAPPDRGHADWGAGVARATAQLLDADSGLLVLGPPSECGPPRAVVDEAAAAASCAWMGPLATVRLWSRADAPTRHAAGLCVTVAPDRLHAELSCEWSGRSGARWARARTLLELIAPAVVGALRVRALTELPSGVFAASAGGRLAERCAPPRREWLSAAPADHPAAGDATLRARYGLTDREAEITRFLVQGRSNADIAAELGIRPATARHHTEHILSKLGVRSRGAVAAVLYELARAPVRRAPRGDYADR